ncbi:MAG TPA: TonB C-terminal domain-containing protein [Vicinamibacterales bacterium]|jgi:TonB family protein|nr:TonB C-terminal domain-containing protein [Vicinamibacterales bacterium]
MTEAVTDIIVARSRAQESLTGTVAWSIGLHLVLIAVVMLMPGAKNVAPPVVMTITLSGSPGPKTEGMSEAASRAVQEVAKPEVAKPVVTAPAPVRPEMTLPNPKVKPRPVVKPKEAPPDASSRRLNTGEEVKSGTAPAASQQIRGQGFGLATSGGNGLGSKMSLDVSNFCCREYLDQMVVAIRARWNNKQPVAGIVGMKFTIQRDGRITDVQIERPSGLAVLDNESQHALLATARLQSLPAQYPNSTLTVHLSFEYER